MTDVADVAAASEAPAPKRHDREAAAPSSRAARRCSRWWSCSASTRSTRPTSGRSRLLAPNIRDHFDLDNGEFLAHRRPWASSLGLLLSIPFGFAADRVKRLPIVIGGAVAFGVFSMLTGLATTVSGCS